MSRWQSPSSGLEWVEPGAGVVVALPASRLSGFDREARRAAEASTVGRWCAPLDGGGLALGEPFRTAVLQCAAGVRLVQWIGADAEQDLVRLAAALPDGDGWAETGSVPAEAGPWLVLSSDDAVDGVPICLEIPEGLSRVRHRMLRTETTEALVFQWTRG
mgnify:CR=1 FL=1